MAPIGYLRAGSVFSGLLGAETPPFPEGLPYLFLQPPLSLAHSELDGGWTVVSTSPQAVRRYLAAPPPAAGAPAAEWSARRIPAGLSGAAAFAVLRPRHTLLAAYNTVTALAGAFVPFLEGFIAPYEVDPARLPPGEKFLGGLKDGFLRVDAGPGGLVIHGHRLLSGGLWILLLGLGSIGAYAGASG